MKGSLVLTILALSACHAIAPRPQTVPAELVPAGFTADECRLVEDSAADSGGGFSSVGGAMDAGSHTHQRAECHHNAALVPAGTICRDDNGKDLPPERCKRKP